MQISTPTDRRSMLRLVAGFTSAALLSGCGGGGGSETAGSGVTVVPSTGSSPAPEAPVVAGAHRLNLALNLAYVGASFYGYAARGSGLAAALTTGVGRAGSVSGARGTSFADPALRAYATELADDKQAHVVGLRDEIGAMAAALPAIDLSPGATGAFSLAAQRAGFVAAGAAFDPYAGDTQFLLGAFLVENVVAAAHRTLLLASDETASPLVAANLADAIYHGGLIRTLLENRAGVDASVLPAFDKAGALLMTLTPSDGATQTSSTIAAFDPNILDADNRPIPFLRATKQVLNVLCLSGGEAGGFLPAGANGVIV